MARQGEQHRGDPIVAAMERVLKAERDGVDRVRDSRGTAERLLADARAEAAAITRRTDQRISRIHTAYLKDIDGEIERLGRSAPDRDETAVSHDRATLDAAARRLAEMLTGGT